MAATRAPRPPKAKRPESKASPGDVTPGEDGETIYQVERDLYGCILWPESQRDDEGYGRHDRRLAHVVAWEQIRGPVPKGKVLDHLCRRRACIEVAHLEPVTQSENLRRRKMKYRVRKLKTCPQGHDLREHGRMTPEGGKVCRKCCGL